MATPTSITATTGIPEHSLPTQNTINDDDMIRIVTKSGSSKLISYFNGIKAYINNIINPAVDKMLKSDGSVKMDTGYVPTVDLDINTKKYSDDKDTIITNSLTLLINNLKANIIANVAYFIGHQINSVNITSSVLTAIVIDFKSNILANTNISDSKANLCVFTDLEQGISYEIIFRFKVVTTVSTAIFAFSGINSKIPANTLNSVTKLTMSNDEIHTIVLTGICDNGTSNEHKLLINTGNQNLIINNMTLSIKKLDINI